MKDLDDQTGSSVRRDARAVEAAAGADGEYPADTHLRRPNQPSRMFNLRLTEAQFDTLQRVARRHHLPMSTMARSWLLERLDQENAPSAPSGKSGGQVIR